MHLVGIRTTTGRRHLSPLTITRRTFGPRWHVAWCIAYYESRRTLNPSPAGPNYGPWQINAAAHPWASPWRMTHSWAYAARVAYRVSDGGTRWGAWTTHSLCGV